MYEARYDKMPTIELTHVLLRTIKESDYPDLFAYGSDPEVTQFLSWGPMEKPSEALWAIQHVFLSRLKKKIPAGYAIVDKRSKKMIGTIDFHTVNHKDNFAEIGYALHRDYWSMGIMTECLQAMIKVGFDYLGFNRIEVRHVSDNLGSEKVIKKCDFRFEGILRKSYYDERKDAYYDIVTYAILKKEYERGELKWQLTK